MTTAPAPYREALGVAFHNQRAAACDRLNELANNLATYGDMEAEFAACAQMEKITRHLKQATEHWHNGKEREAFRELEWALGKGE